MTTENKIKYFENREDWRKWLMDNFETSCEIWFVFPYKSSGKKGILYNDAVEEALCFDWIDSTTKPLDKDSKTRSHTDNFGENNVKCLIAKGICRFVPHSSAGGF